MEPYLNTLIVHEAMNEQHIKGIGLINQGKFIEAIKVLLPIYDKGKKLSDQRSLVDSLFHIGSTLQTKFNDYKESFVIYNTILSKEKVTEALDDFLINAWHNYALSNMIFGDKKYSAVILKEVVKKRTALFGADHEHTIVPKYSLAACLQANEELHESFKYFNEIYNLRLKNLGKYDKETLRMRNHVAEVYYQLGKNHEAIRMYEPVIEKYKKNYFDEDALYTAQLNLASAYSRINDWKTSFEIYREINKKQMKSLSSNRNETLEILSSLGKVLINYRQYDHAVNMYKEVLEGYKTMFGSKHQKTLEIEKKINSLRNKTVHFFAKTGNVILMDFPVRLDADVVNFQDDNKNTPLHYAVENGHMDAISFLLKSGAIFNVKNKENKDPLQLAKDISIKNLFISAAKLFKSIQNGDYDQVAELVKINSIINCKDLNGYTPLHWSVNNNNKKITILLLKNGADCFQKTSKGNTALHIASSKGFEEIVDILLKNVHKNKLSNFVNARTVGGNSALHASCKKGSLAIVEILLKNGAYFDLENKEGEIPIEISKNENIIKLLKFIENCFKNVKNDEIEIINKLKAATSNQLDILKKVCNFNGKTLLQEAEVCKNKRITKALKKIL